MKLSIRSKLTAGFSAVLVLMAAAAAIGGWAVFSLGRTRVAARLNAVALEIQVHNLEAERRVAKYLSPARTSASQKSGEAFLEEAGFEIHEMQSLVAQASTLAPSGELQQDVHKIEEAMNRYEQALGKAVEAKKHGAGSGEMQAELAEYEDAAESLHESAEDGEAAAKYASQSSMESVDRLSGKLMFVVIGICAFGLLLGTVVSYKLGRAILMPVRHLKDVAENVSLGNLDVAVRRYSEDEIGDLADSFSRMVTAVKFYRLEAEMLQAEAESERGAQ